MILYFFTNIYSSALFLALFKKLFCKSVYRMYQMYQLKRKSIICLQTGPKLSDKNVIGNTV